MPVCALVGTTAAPTRQALRSEVALADNAKLLTLDARADDTPDSPEASFVVPAEAANLPSFSSLRPAGVSLSQMNADWHLSEEETGSGQQMKLDPAFPFLHSHSCIGPWRQTGSCGAGGDAARSRLFCRPPTQPQILCGQHGRLWQTIVKFQSTEQSIKCRQVQAGAQIVAIDTCDHQQIAASISKERIETRSRASTESTGKFATGRTSHACVLLCVYR